MTLDEVTDQLADVLRSGRKYHFIEQAHRVLAQVPTAPRLAEMTLRTLLELGWGGPARELLQLRPELGQVRRRHPELEAALVDAPNGRVPWTQREEIFRGNVAVLLRHRPHLRELVESLPQTLTGVHLYRTLEGHYQISRRRPGQLREWLGSLTDEGDGTALELPPRGQLGATAVVGVRTGAVLERVYQDSHHLLLTYSHPLYIIEPDPIRFGAWLHCADHSLLLDDERVYFFIGGEGGGRLTELLAENPGLRIPDVSIDQSGLGVGEATTRVRVVVESATRHRETELARCTAELEQRYRARDAAYWAEHFRPPCLPSDRQAGKILGITSRFTTVLQYSTRDALGALEEMGYEPHVMIETADHFQYSELEVCRRILELDPVMVLLLDHLRYESPHLPKNLPVLTWIQDPLGNLLCRRAGESIGPFDFVCGYYQERCVSEFGYPADQFEDTNVPVSARIFHDAEPDGESMARYACDICFVSNASDPVERFYRAEIKNYPPGYRPLLELIYRRAMEILDLDDHQGIGVAAQNLVRSAVAETGLTLDGAQTTHVSSHFAYRLLDWGRRQQALEWVAAWARRTGRVFRIYGRGWEKHPTLAEFAAGVIEHGEPLRCATRASRLALQLLGFRHQRALETLASGTLPLTRYCPVDFAGLPLETYVSQREAGLHPEGVATVFPRLERVVFRTPEEFEVLAERYLADEAQRHEVLSDLRQIVLRDYTYAAVMRKVIGAFHASLVRGAAEQAESPKPAAVHTPVGS